MASVHKTGLYHCSCKKWGIKKRLPMIYFAVSCGDPPTWNGENQ